MKFKPGDKVWVRSANGAMTRKGVVLPNPYGDLHAVPGTQYLVDLESVKYLNECGSVRSARESNMWPRDDDDRQLSSWDVGVWRPRSIVEQISDLMTAVYRQREGE